MPDFEKYLPENSYWSNYSPNSKPGTLPPGPWNDEPGTVAWVTEQGNPCFMKRSLEGNWLGYVGVQESSPWYTADRDATSALQVHGGVTYDEKGLQNHLERFGLSLKDSGQNLRWFGFDCAHGGDVVPVMQALMPAFYTSGTYRDVAYVVNECQLLAEQLETKTPESVASEKENMLEEYFKELLNK